MKQIINKKTAFCIVMVFAIFMSLVPGGMAEDAEKTIVEFSSAEEILKYANNGNTLEVTTENLGNYSVSGKTSINAAETKNLFNVSMQNADFSAYKYLNVRIYSPSEAAFGVCVPVYDAKGIYSLYGFQANWSGWKVISMPLDKPKFLKSKDFDFKAISSVSFGVNQWIDFFGEWNGEHFFNFDRVWLSEEMPEEAIEKDNSVDEYGNKMLAQFSSESEISKFKNLMPKSNIEPTEENTRLYPVSAKCSIAAETGKSLIEFSGIELDLSEYQYLNLWVYSPEVSASGICVPIYDNNGLYSLYVFDVDWQGWKMITLNLKKPKYQKPGFDFTNITNITFGINQWVNDVNPWSKESYINVDKIWLSPWEMQPFLLEEFNFPSGCSSVPAADTQLRLMFSNPISDIKKEDIIITENGADSDADFSAEFKEKLLIINFNDELKKSGLYDLQFNIFDIYGNDAAGIKYSFKTDNRYVKKPVFKGENGQTTNEMPSGKISVSAEISDETAQAALIAVIYDKSGEPRNIYKAERENGAKAEIQNIPVSADESAVAFLCDSPATMNLLRNDYAVLLPAGFDEEESFFRGAAENSGTVDLSSVKLTGDQLDISGSVSGDIGFVILKISDGSGNPVKLFKFDTLKDKNFIKHYVLPDSDFASGKYGVCAYAYGSSSAKHEFYYIKQSEQIKICSDINNATDENDVKEILSGYSEMLMPDLKNDLDFSHIYLTVFEQRPYSSFTDMIKTIQNAQELIEELNKCNWTTLSGFLADNYAVVLYGCSDYEKYKAMSEKQKNIVNQEIYRQQSSFKTFALFRTAFSSAIKICQNNDGGSEITHPRPGGGGGSTGGGGGQGKLIIGTPVKETQPEEETYSFNDIEDLAWAKDYIIDLCKRNIISKSDDNKFRPFDSITREEFLKMLLAAFNMETAEGKSRFEDVKDNEWYAPYVTAALRFGIVKGKSDTVFGTGEAISREDMAVMMLRAAQKNNISFPETAEEIIFSDNGEISGYAAEAVKILQKAGFINGDGDKMFQPKAELTRAQSAKVIGCLVLLINQTGGN